MTDGLLHLVRENEASQAYEPQYFGLPSHYEGEYRVSTSRDKHIIGYRVVHEMLGNWRRITIKVSPWPIDDEAAGGQTTEIGFEVPSPTPTKFIAPPIIRHNLVGFFFRYDKVVGKVAIGRISNEESHKPTAGGIVIIEGLAR